MVIDGDTCWAPRSCKHPRGYMVVLYIYWMTTDSCYASGSRDDAWVMNLTEDNCALSWVIDWDKNRGLHVHPVGGH